MCVGIQPRFHHLLSVGFGIVLSLLFVLPSAMAQAGADPDAVVTSAECSPRGDIIVELSNFFSFEVESIAVHSSGGAAMQTAAAVRREIASHYRATAVRVRQNGPDEPSLAVSVVRHSDLAGAVQPAVMDSNGVPTLVLNWTTATADVAALLNRGGQACGPALPDHAPAILAMRDDSLDAGAANMVADTSPRSTRVPIGLATGAIACAGAGVLAARRRNGSTGEDEVEVGPTRPAVEATPAPQRTPEQATESTTVRPRVISLDHKPIQRSANAPNITVSRAPVDTNSRSGASVLSRLVGKINPTPNDVVHGREAFAELLDTHWSTFEAGGANGAIASIALSELGAVRLRLGNNAADGLFNEVAFIVAGSCRPGDIVGLTFDDRLAVLMPQITPKQAHRMLEDVAQKITATDFTAAGERVLLTPTTGYAMFSDTGSLAEVLKGAEDARAMSRLNLDLDVERWDPSMSRPHEAEGSTLWSRVKEKLRTPLQIAITIVFAWVLPFWAYLSLDAAGFDISFGIYLVLVAALVTTGAFILAEGVMAVKQKEPPELPPEAFPKATALIAAYMPNEAATIIETVEAFLALDYPNDLQIILAYNTPEPMPVEEHLDRIAAEHPNFVPVRIDGSNSKAQNVNAALSMANGKFIGMFDADHQPRPDAFTRAWRWIDDGYDVVQGHCLTRNGDASWLAKMIAVEFEAIYAVAHPGRAKMHHFGVFGGSNGFWRTELLHETRMRGSMLTEDIDSSMRVIENGGKIRSDRLLVSRELATTTFQQVWNQRMRWAQGWFQVSLQHMKYVVKSSTLTVRQKFGILHLLVWREIYPWISQQLFPLLAFWAVQSGGVTRLDWTVPIFVATSIFTFSVGPIQAIYAYRLADPEIKQHKKWFWGYLLFTTPFYTEYKNLIARVAHVKQFMGESNWRVTPRSADPVPGPGG